MSWRCPTCVHPEGYDRLSGPCPTCRGSGEVENEPLGPDLLPEIASPWDEAELDEWSCPATWRAERTLREWGLSEAVSEHGDAATYGLCLVCHAPRTIARTIDDDGATLAMVCSVDPSHYGGWKP